jgi:HEPN domain-containing protein
MEEKEEFIEYWLTTAERDLITAEHLFESGDYHYCLFIAHLVLEKALKALYVKNIDKDTPYKHNLYYLSEKCNLKLNDEQKKFLITVTSFNMEGRYPDKKFLFYKRCTKEFTTEWFNKIKEFYTWLKTLIK